MLFKYKKLRFNKINNFSMHSVADFQHFPEELYVI